MKYIIRLASINDKEIILDFIKNHWKHDHIFLQCDKLFMWQYANYSTQSLNFIIAINPKTQRIDSLMGFIPAGHFDASLAGIAEIGGAIWKNSSNNMILGLQVFTYLIKNYGRETYYGLGISKQSEEIYNTLNYPVGLMEHYYIPRQSNQYVLISINDNTLPPQIFKDANISEIDAQELRKIQLEHHSKPHKTIDHFYNKYARHPLYKYRFYGIFDEALLLAIVVIRKVTAKHLNISCLRIVDWLGTYDIPLDLRTGLNKLIVENDVEYIDLMCKVDADRHFVERGFRLKDPLKETVPNYFEPFITENRDIKYVFKSIHPKLSFFKGDTDQDRPNNLAELS